MKIITKFKDYYDFYSTNFGGPDPKVVYERHLLNDLSQIYFNDDSKIKNDEVDLVLRLANTIYDYDFRWLIVCGKKFLLFRKSEYPKTQIWTAYKNSTEVEKHLNLLKGKRSRWEVYPRKTPEYYMGEFSQKNLDFCIKHKSPVVVIEGGRFTTDTPILGDIINFVSMYPAEQIYQDISYFMLNQINGSPDIDPPVVLDDKFKIEYAGFDKKYSFRPAMRK
jgi:hypothetical protein